MFVYATQRGCPTLQLFAFRKTVSHRKRPQFVVYLLMVLGSGSSASRCRPIRKLTPSGLVT